MLRLCLKCPLFFACTSATSRRNNMQMQCGAQTYYVNARATLNGQQRGPRGVYAWKCSCWFIAKSPWRCLPLSSLLDIAAILSPCVSSCRSAQQRMAHSRATRQRRRGIQIVYSAAFDSVNNLHACRVRGVSEPGGVGSGFPLTPAMRNLMTRRELSAQPAFPDFI